MSASLDSLSPAIQAVTARFAGMVRRVGWRHHLSAADVDELLQEVRIRLWRARGDGQSIDATPASYAYRVARSAAVDMIRRRSARPEDAVDVVTLYCMPDVATGDTPDRGVEAIELADQIDEAVNLIHTTRRPAVRMHLAGYSRDEIAERMGWTEAKTRNLVYRGLAELRLRLTSMGIGPTVAT